MSLEIITNYISITEDMDLSTRLNAENANRSVTSLKESFCNSEIWKLNPNDERRLIITITADLEKIMLIDQKYVHP